MAHIDYADGYYDGAVNSTGKPHGKGVFHWSNGDKYEGNFVDGKPNGRGIADFTNGDKYEGDFVNGNRTGRGTFY
jgi:hypothetical protein